MKRILLSILLLLCSSATFAQWTFTIQVRYSGDCGGINGINALNALSYEAAYKNMQIPTKSECEALRNQISSIRQGYGGCYASFVCGPCTGHDIGGTVSADPNSSLNIFQQGTAITPHNRANEVLTWADEFVKKWQDTLRIISDYVFRYGGSINGEEVSFEEYLNSRYGQVDDYSSSDRNALKKGDASDSVTVFQKADEDSLNGYVLDYYDENGIPHFKKGKVEKLTYEKDGKTYFKGVENNNTLTELPNTITMDEPEDTRTPLQKKIDSLRRLNQINDVPEDERESTLGKVLDKAGELWKEWGGPEAVDEFSSGVVGEIVNTYGTVASTAYSTLSTGLDLKDAEVGFAQDVLDNINQLSKSNFTKSDADKAWDNLEKAKDKLQIAIVKMIAVTPLEKAAGTLFKTYNKLFKWF